MRKVKDIGLRAKGVGREAPYYRQFVPDSKFHTLSPKPLALCLMLLTLCSLFSYGCSKVEPPVDYYHTVVEMEEQGEQVRRDTGRSPGEVVVPATEPEPIKVADVPAQQETPGEPQPEVEETPAIEQEEQTQEEPPRREIVQEPVPPSEPGPIALAPDVIKSALNGSDLGISVRAVELVNGRLSDGKNSVRVYFLPGTVDVIDARFGAICAVLYYLNSETKTIDTVAGIAEDEQTNLLAILQSSMSDITAWVTAEITRAEWYTRITKKIL